VVHNGVIENAEELRAKLIADGVKFLSRRHRGARHLIAAVDSPDIEDAVRRVLPEMSATYGIAVSTRASRPDRRRPATAAR